MIARHDCKTISLTVLGKKKRVVGAGACHNRLASVAKKQVMALKCIRQLLAMNTDMNTRGGRGGHVRSRLL